MDPYWHKKEARKRSHFGMTQPKRMAIRIPCKPKQKQIEPNFQLSLQKFAQIS